jgi:hypothetical protein
MRIGASVVTKAMDLKVSSKANAEYIITLTGETGPTTGHKMCSISCKSAVARASAERKRIVRAYQNDDIITMTYRSGDMDYIAEGIISSLEFGSSVNKKDEFDFEFEGTESPIQDV